MRFFLFSTLLLSIVIMFSGCEEETTPTGNYFPLAMGNRWTYHYIYIENGEVKTNTWVEYQVTEHEILDDGSEYWLMSPMRIKTANEHVFMANDYDYKFLLAADQQTGDISERGFYCQTDAVYTLDEVKSEYTVSAGTFSNVRVYTYDWHSPASYEHSDHSGRDLYAEGVGLIYHEESGSVDGSGMLPGYNYSRSAELVSYGIGE